jgi:hypothetical protein
MMLGYLFQYFVLLERKYFYLSEKVYLTRKILTSSNDYGILLIESLIVKNNAQILTILEIFEASHFLNKYCKQMADGYLLWGQENLPTSGLNSKQSKHYRILGTGTGL